MKMRHDDTTMSFQYVELISLSIGRYMVTHLHFVRMESYFLSLSLQRFHVKSYIV
jgi:hypothetical protein